MATATKVQTYRVYYVYPNDVTEYAARIQATDADSADRIFRNGLTDDDQWNVTVTRIERQP